MSMTRKDFEALAAIVRDAGADMGLSVPPYIADALTPAQRMALAERLAAICARHNPAFDHARFYAACKRKGE